MNKHISTIPELREIQIIVIGTGGNGTKILAGLKNLHHAMIALGKPEIHVTAIDPDEVSPANLARQSFYQSDIGQSKAKVLINRLNLACGLHWKAIQDRAENCMGILNISEIIITCVDSRAARKAIALVLKNNSTTRYWMDLGNDRYTGQVLIGQVGQNKTLPNISDFYPEIFDTDLPEDNTPSCSTLEAIEKQDLFVNDAVVSYALNLLWRLLKHGELEFQGGFVNLETGQTRPIPIRSCDET